MFLWHFRPNPLRKTVIQKIWLRKRINFQKVCSYFTAKIVFQVEIIFGWLNIGTKIMRILTIFPNDFFLLLHIKTMLAVNIHYLKTKVNIRSFQILCRTQLFSLLVTAFQENVSFHSQNYSLCTRVRNTLSKKKIYIYFF